MKNSRTQYRKVCSHCGLIAISGPSCDVVAMKEHGLWNNIKRKYYICPGSGKSALTVKTRKIVGRLFARRNENK